MGQKGLDFKHKEVINIKDGKRLGYVQDVTADLKTGNIVLIIEKFISYSKISFKSSKKWSLQITITLSSFFIKSSPLGIITLLLDMLCMFIIVPLCSLNDMIGKIVSQIVVTVGNYIISKLFVFKKED